MTPSCLEVELKKEGRDREEKIRDIQCVLNSAAEPFNEESPQFMSPLFLPTVLHDSTDLHIASCLPINMEIYK